MQNEISSGTMLGIVLIALAAVIGLGFGVFSIAKGVSNEGVVNVQDNLSTVSQSAYDDFDNKVVTGTQVKAAYRQFQGKPVAIIVNTQAMTNGVKNYPSHGSFLLSVGAKPYVNYNAILASDSKGTAATSTPGFVTGDSSGAVLKGSGLTNSVVVDSKNTGIMMAAYPFALADDGKVIYDANTGGFDVAGNCEFISTSAKFQANLIKDASEETIGVAFTQLKK